MVVFGWVVKNVVSLVGLGLLVVGFFWLVSCCV